MRGWKCQMLNMRMTVNSLDVTVCPTGILSQRMFVMLPCGGVGVSENTHIHTQNTDELGTEGTQGTSQMGN